MQFVPDVYDAVANLTGIRLNGATKAAMCEVVDPGAKQQAAFAGAFYPGVHGTFPLVLHPIIIYSVFYQLDPEEVPADCGYTMVYTCDARKPD
ncbi:hypothetical protein GPECTOR_11g288 [Gonium pectorale]|uniref:Uncharacterized protein n=1 Tax=Gonium pectorale TaxID=33097 RepID=A0A150GPU1_GONPE|nr:hypothetical protein GPECTOR_11g288 [Gonium pectorale]|eukprot:KXZ51849.1 hypothetical protein GPECTOR_11g288 [Gonium pectorale]